MLAVPTASHLELVAYLLLTRSVSSGTTQQCRRNILIGNADGRSGFAPRSTVVALRADNEQRRLMGDTDGDSMGHRTSACTYTLLA